MKIRFFLVLSVFFILYGALSTNLYRIQVLKRSHYFELAQARGTLIQQSALRRGDIFATNRSGADIPIALNRDYPNIYVDPSRVGDPEETASRLASVIGWSVDDLRRAFAASTTAYRLLVGRASSSVVDAVSELNLPGIGIQQGQYRFYPFEHFASQVLGFVGRNSGTLEPSGLYGLEKLHNTTLAAGGALRLTIDQGVQMQAENMLRELTSQFNATGGTIIVQEPTSGRILAVANRPDFDPNTYSEFSVGSFMNPAVQLVYEPGSVFKPFTMAAGIDLGVITPETTFVDMGSVTLNGKTIHNARDQVYGKITMTQVLEHSVNTGSVFAAQTIGRESFRRYVSLFGFGERTNVDLPNEVSGSVRNIESSKAQDIDFATASFGQGTSVTPIQLISAFSSLANGGLLMQPYINRDREPLVVRRVIQKETAEQITTMLESTVEKAGVAAIPGYRIAGKTGTALIPEHGGYSDAMIHTFVGFAPASNPAFTILIKLDRPEVGDLAGRTVVPSFRKFAQFLLNYYGIAPDAL